MTGPPRAQGRSAPRTRSRLASVLVRVLVPAALSACLLALPSAALAERVAIISVGCTDSHRLKDDPIVFPGQPGASHLHEFTGSWSTDAFSTLASMRASGHTCELDDTAGYWTPVLYNAQGELIKKRFAAAYYLGNQTNRKYIQPFPAGLKMIVSMQDSYDHGGGWHCGNSSHNLAILSPSTIPNCEGLDDGPGGIYPDITLLEAKLVFPDCWDGVNLDSPDHKSHMAFSDDVTNLCPPSHPVPVPRLNFKNVYDTYGGPGITLSSGGPGDDARRLLEHLGPDEVRSAREVLHQQQRPRLVEGAALQRRPDEPGEPQLSGPDSAGRRAVLLAAAARPQPTLDRAEWPVRRPDAERYRNRSRRRDRRRRRLEGRVHGRQPPSAGEELQRPDRQRRADRDRPRAALWVHVGHRRVSPTAPTRSARRPSTRRAVAPSRGGSR